MISKLLEYLQDKKIVILGAGREGKSTYQFIRRHLCDKKLTIMDASEEILKEDFVSKDENLEVIIEKEPLKLLENYDLVIKSPGVSFKGKDISSIREKIVSQLELLLKFVPIYTIGITGTKGKSTTSSLIYQMLMDQNVKTKLIGNIGKPAFDELEEMTEDMKVVIEMSSHQLEYMDVCPNISIVLNIFEEHLDHYNGYIDYINAKMNIARFQKEEDYFLYNDENKEIKDALKNMNIISNEYKVIFNQRPENTKNSIYRENGFVCIKGEEVYKENLERKLLGDHNLNDIMFVLGVGKILGLDSKKTIETIANFEGLPHRLEKVGTYDQVTYYNDSIATIPEAAINSIKALKNVNTIIIGGMDRGIDYNSFIEYLNNSPIEHIICLPDTGRKIGKAITNINIDVFQVKDLAEAVDVAKKITKKQTICLLSPAAASYGFFKNFEDRGNVFKELVRK